MHHECTDHSKVVLVEMGADPVLAGGGVEPKSPGDVGTAGLADGGGALAA